MKHPYAQMRRAAAFYATSPTGQYDDEATWALQHFPALLDALIELTIRCDGREGVRPDGSNIQTMKAHAAIQAAIGDCDDDHEQTWTVEYRREILGNMKWEVKQGIAHRGLFHTEAAARAAFPSQTLTKVGG